MLWGRPLGSLSLCISLLLMVTLPALPAEEAPNLAREGWAFQSTTYNKHGEPQNAIDGSTANNYLRGHCTHTQLERNPWWTVDLRAEFRIFTVDVTNRGDCCAERLDGAEIRIGNLPEEGGITNPSCAMISSLGRGETGSFDCGGMQGQYVTITIPGIQYLTVCEVQVFGERVEASGDLNSANGTETSAIEQWLKRTKTPRQPLEDEYMEQFDSRGVPNVAREGRAFQSTTYDSLGKPENAIDGSTSTNYFRGHCTHTQLERNPWWTVDLRAEFRIFTVRVTNRGDCCAERLNDAEIRVGNLPEEGGITNPRCATISFLGQEESESFDCSEMQGQYVTITIPGFQYLTVCEVQVFGVRVEASGDLNSANGTETSAIEQWLKRTKTPRQPLEDEYMEQFDSRGVPNVAREGRAFQSSTFDWRGEPENAIDGSTSNNYGWGHCTHTQLEWNPWWTVDLRAEFRIFTVRVTNRGDCCAERLDGAEIRIGNLPEEGGITNPRCATISSLDPGEPDSFDCGGMQGQYVTVTIPGFQYLTVCEVQVFGVRVEASGQSSGSSVRELDKLAALLSISTIVTTIKKSFRAF